MTGSPPRLGVRHGPGGLSVMEVVQATKGCEVVWLVDGRELHSRADLRVLRRFGEVIDIAAGSAEDAAAALAEHATDGVVTFHDAGMVRLAEVAELLGVAFHSPATARSLTDKVEQRAVLRAAGLPTPQVWTLGPRMTDREWRTLAEQVSWPAVLKPRGGSGSRDVYLVGDAEETALVLAAMERPAAMLLEEYLPDLPPEGPPNFARFVSVESAVAGGETRHLAITGRFALAEPFRESGSFVPAPLEPEAEKEILGTVDEVIAALGVRHGCLHTEIKETPAGPRVIEVNGRLGGAVPGMVRRAMGVDLIDLAVRLALGGTLAGTEPAQASAVAYHFFVQPPKVVGWLAGIEGIEVVARQPGVEEIQAQKAVGDPVDWRVGTRSVLIEVAGTAPSHEALCELDDLIHRELRFAFDS